MGRGGSQSGVGTDIVGEAQLSVTLCSEKMEGRGKDSPINPLGVQPNHGWDRLPPLLPDLTAVPHPESAAHPLLLYTRGM